MSVDIEKLASRVAALEKRMASEELIDPKDKKEASERDMLAAEIAALEKRIGSGIAPVTAADVKSKTAADEKEEDKKDDEKKASLVDPSGIEESITQDYLKEVEDLEHGEELTTGDSMLDIAPTEFVARLKNASARLDRVADYFEKTGRTAEAMRIDKIADAIDARVATFTKE